MLQCAGPLDSFVQGSPKTLIGKTLIGGKPAARITDALAHGGKIPVGAVKTFIGEGPPDDVACRDCLKAAAKSGSATVS
jgi:hypothetical protein